MGISSGRGQACRALAFHVADDQLAEVRGTRAAVVCGLVIAVLDVFSCKLNGDAASSFSGRPAGHGVVVGFSHCTGCGCGTAREYVAGSGIRV